MWATSALTVVLIDFGTKCTIKWNVSFQRQITELSDFCRQPGDFDTVYLDCSVLSNHLDFHFVQANRQLDVLGAVAAQLKYKVESSIAQVYSDSVTTIKVELRLQDGTHNGAWGARITGG